jgi:hypothetical protein
MNKSKTDLANKQSQMQLKMDFCKPVEQKFDGGDVCTDGGLLMLRKADERLHLTELAAFCLGDKRRPDLIRHNLRDLFRQRVYAIAAGYEDCNDAAKLRFDAMHRLALGYEPGSEHLLASQPSLSRFEALADQVSNLALEKLLVHTYVRRFKKAPKVLKLAMDTSCDETYGYQQLSFYNGFYEHDCYVPLFIFTDCGFPLCALLRAGNAGPAEHSLRMLKQVVHELRLSWPDVRIELTADAAFGIPEIFEYCEANEITYYIAVKGHSGLAYHSEPLVRKCKAEFEELGVQGPELKKYGKLADPKARYLAWRQREERMRFQGKGEGRMQEIFEDQLAVRKYGEFKYEAREWDKERRFIVRAEFTKQGPDVRYVVTNATGKRPSVIYEDKYCRRARCENWIKDLKNYLKIDRTSCQEFTANQFRLFLHTFAYILFWEVKQRAKLKEMTVESLRLQLIKIGVLVKEAATKVTLHLASNFPWRTQYELAWQHL